MKQLGKLISGLNGFVQFLSFIAIVVGVCVAGFEYRQQLERGYKQNSFDFVIRFQEGHIAKARSVVFKPWLRYDLAKFVAAKPSKRAIQALVDKIVVSGSTDDPDTDLRTNISLLVEFFDSASACVEQSICDRTVMEQQLGPYATGFFCLYRSAISQMRDAQRLRDFGSGLRKLANLKC